MPNNHFVCGKFSIKAKSTLSNLKPSGKLAIGGVAPKYIDAGRWLKGAIWDKSLTLRLVPIIHVPTNSCSPTRYPLKFYVVFVHCDYMPPQRHN